MTAAPKTLDELRQAIDETDDALHDLVMRRMELAAAVKAAKTGAPGPAWRPAREAKIFRRLMERHAGDFSPLSLFAIWRQLISESLMAQAPLGVAALDSTFAIAAGHFPTCDVFPVHRPEEALAEAAGDERVVALLPGPEEGVWAMLPKIVAQRRKTPELHLLAVLPFIDYDDPGPESRGLDAVSAYAFARAAPEPSGADATLIVSFWTPDGELPRNPRKHPKIPPSEPARADRAGARLFAVADGASVFEMPGLVAAADPRLANFQAPMILGACALPIRLDLSVEPGLTDDEPNRE